MRGTIPVLLTAVMLAGCGSDDAPSTTGLATPGAVPSTTTMAAVPSTGATAPAGAPPSTGEAPAPGTTTTDTETTVPDADRPVPCPSDQAGTAGVYDARALEGVALADAEAAAKDHGCTVRVARRDGEDLVLTQDLSTSRINVEVRKGRVTRVLGVS